MGILDDAIKEHLELKRQSGAGPDDLQKLENEAFGPVDDSDLADEPISDEAAEAATQFMKVDAGDPPVAPEADASSLAPETAPDPPAGEEPPVAAEPPSAPETAESPFVQDAPIESSSPEQDAPSEADAMEHEIISAPESGDTEPPFGPEPESKGPNTEERHAISEHPTELYDVAAEISAGQESPSEEDLYDAEASDPRLVPPEPVGESLEVSQPDAEDGSDAAPDSEASADTDDEPGDIGAEAELALGEEEDDDFFSDQSLSDELDQALDAPDLSAPEASPTPPPADPPPSDPPTEAYDRESEPASEPEPESTDDEPDAEVAAPPEAAPAVEPGDAEPAEPAPEPADEPAPEPDPERTPPADPGPEESEGGGSFYNADEDVLEETPDFLQDTPEHERLWFEQKPPKDFDFDD